MSRQSVGSIVRLLVLTATAAVLPMTGCAPPPGPSHPGGGAAAPDTYVSLGDSNAAGPLIPDQFLDPIGCLRSDHNYAHLLTNRIHVDRLVDVSCSGATTDNMAAPQQLLIGQVPRQLDAVDARTKVVTISIGGNDIGFAEILATCLPRVLFLQPCTSAFLHDGVDTMAERIEALGPKLDAVFAEIKQRAPSAKLFFVGYVHVTPESGSCFPTVPVLPADLPYLRATWKALDDMLQSRTEAAGGTYVDGISDAVGRDGCAPAGVKWVEGIFPTSPAAPAHTNADGHRGIADLLAPAINREVHE